MAFEDIDRYSFGDFDDDVAVGETVEIPPNNIPGEVAQPPPVQEAPCYPTHNRTPNTLIFNQDYDT